MTGLPLPVQPWWRRVLGERPDETVLRAIFRCLLGLTVVVVCHDLYTQLERERATAPTLDQTHPPPFLPSSRPDVPAEDRPGQSAPTELGEPMTLELLPEGRLEASGAITPGTAERFRIELEKRGDYVRTVVLNSPGGSVRDALAMSRLIREKGLSTQVEASGHCASSCPLVFAGGRERLAQQGASIGVHQVTAVPVAGGETVTAQPASFVDAQRISAECQRLLVEMGVDPQVWIHAMETPPDQIFYFKPEELSRLKLATKVTRSSE